MTDSATLIADTAVSLAAAGGLAILIGRVGEQDGTAPLGARFLTVLWVLAILMVVRVLHWGTGLGVFTVITIIAAGLVPLAALLLAEGLQRQHAPGRLKTVVAGGAAGIVVLACLPAAYADPWRMGVLLIYQFASFALIAGMVIRRDRATLSDAENQAIDRIALSLLLILPFLATDFRTLQADFPVRLGGIAVLGLCWLALALGRVGLRRRDIVQRFVALLLAVALTGWIVAAIGGLDLRAGLQAGAVILAAVLLLAVAQASAALTGAERQNTVLRHLAEGDLTDAVAFLRALQRRTGTDEALFLAEPDLTDFDADVLRRIFARHPVCAAGETGGLPEAEREQLVWLFEKYEATHVLLVTPAPLTLLVMSNPALTGSVAAMLELQAVQRMAALIGARGAA